MADYISTLEQKQMKNIQNFILLVGHSNVFFLQLYKLMNILARFCMETGKNNNWVGKKRLEKYIILNFSVQLHWKRMQPIYLSQNKSRCCISSAAANTEACLWSLLLSVGHSSMVEPSKEVIFKVEKRIIHIKGHLLSNLKWFTAVCGAARTASP